VPSYEAILKLIWAAIPARVLGVLAAIFSAVSDGTWYFRLFDLWFSDARRFQDRQI